MSVNITRNEEREERMLTVEVMLKKHCYLEEQLELLEKAKNYVIKYLNQAEDKYVRHVKDYDIEYFYVYILVTEIDEENNKINCSFGNLEEYSDIFLDTKFPKMLFEIWLEKYGWTFHHVDDDGETKAYIEHVTRL